MTSVAIIIPAYNQGYWLNDAVSSAVSQNYENLEVVVINDGSTDPVSNRVFEAIDHPLVRKIKTENQGLAEARNTAIRSTNAEFILPLDSDNRIAPDYLTKTVPILEENPNVGIVYTDAEYFGQKSGRWELEPFSFPEILISPQIDACALYRKSDWEKVGGYKRDMIYAWEDYDFWLSLIGTGLEVKKVPEALFHYRKTEGSMACIDRAKMLYSFRKLFQHHKELYIDNIQTLFGAVIDSNPFREAKEPIETFELYVPGKGGFTSENILRQSYQQGLWSRITFLVTQPQDSKENGQMMRFDPGASLGIYDIASITILDASNDVELWSAKNKPELKKLVACGSSLVVKHDRYFRLLNTQSDPYFYLPKTDALDTDAPLRIDIWIRFTPDLKALTKEIEIVSGPQEQFAKVQDLEANNQFLREQEALLKYQEIGLREEAQNLRNTNTLLKAEMDKQHGVTKSIQAELIALQSDFKALLEKNQTLSRQLKEAKESSVIHDSQEGLQTESDSKKVKRKKFF